MKIRRVLVIGVAILCALILVDQPVIEVQESDAGAFVLGALAIGLLAGWLLREHLIDDNGVDPDTVNQIIQQDYANYRSAWVNQIDNWENSFAEVDAQGYNLLNLFNGTALYFCRRAENKVAEYVGYSDWKNVAPHILEEYENSSSDMVTAVAIGFQHIFDDISAEVNSATSLKSDGIIEDIKWRDMSLFPTGKTYYLYFMVDGTILHPKNESTIANADAVTDWIDFKYNSNGVVTGYDLANEVDYSPDAPLTYTNYLFCHSGYGITYWGYNYYTYGKLQVKINGQAWVNWSIPEYMKTWNKEFFDANIDTANYILSCAKAKWSYYRAKGWTNTSDIPEDEIIIPPDVIFDNPEVLENFTSDDMLNFYYAYLTQLGKQYMDAYNETLKAKNDFFNVSDGNYSGIAIIDTSEDGRFDKSDWNDYSYLKPSKWADVSSDGRITLDEWLDSLEDDYGVFDATDVPYSNNTIIVNATLKKWNGAVWTTYFIEDECWVFPTEEDLTLKSGETYNISQDATGDYAINQTVRIFNRDTKYTYECHPLETGKWYHLVIHGVYDANGNLLLNHTWAVTDLNNWVYTEYGENLTSFSADWDDPADLLDDDDDSAGGVAPSGSSSSGGFIGEFKFWIMLGCLGAGAGAFLLAPNGKKGRKWKVAGLFFILIGGVILIYYYVYPWLTDFASGLSNLNPLNWF